MPMEALSEATQILLTKPGELPQSQIVSLSFKICKITHFCKNIKLGLEAMDHQSLFTCISIY